MVNDFKVPNSVETSYTLIHQQMELEIIQTNRQLILDCSSRELSIHSWAMVPYEWILKAPPLIPRNNEMYVKCNEIIPCI